MQRPSNALPAGAIKRAIAGTVLITFYIVGQVGAALADPAVPTEYKSEVTAVEPATDAVSLRVVGGDSFIEISVSAGHVVEISGYFGEPYIRIAADGTVSVNDRSPSNYVNEDRFGVSEVPPSADADAAPEWEVVAADGRYAWHDHRTHWMATSRPPGIAGDSIQQVFAWELPIEVDGTRRLVSGTLDWYPSPNALPPLIGAALAVAALTALVRRGTDRVHFVAGLGTIAAIVALVLTLTEWLATPAVARAFPMAAAAPTSAALMFASAAIIAGRRRVTAVQLIVVGCVALAVFVFGAIGVFTKPLLPSPVADPIERFTTALIAWLMLAMGAIAVRELVSIAAPRPGENHAAG